jgi:hypothetical protein
VTEIVVVALEPVQVEQHEHEWPLGAGLRDAAF